MRESASGAELKQIILNHALEIGDGELESKALERRFEEDRGRLRDWFGCVIEHDSKISPYTLTYIQTPLIDLSEDAAQGLAFLRANFSAPKALMGEEVGALMEQITRVLPLQTRRTIDKQRKMIEMDLVVKDSRPIPEKIWQDIESTLGSRRLMMLYRDRNDLQPWWYDIEPERWFVETGHLYLFARCNSAHNPDKKDRENQHIHFRVDRIHETRPLPDHFTPRRPYTHELEYTLSPEIAKGGVTEHFKGQQVFYQDDGSAKISVASDNLFIDLRKLLHYGASCKVIGGDEAVAEMKKIIHDMNQIYT